MFDETLHASWDERSHRGLTTLTSFGLEALVVAALLIVPLLRPISMPSLRQLSSPVSLTPAPPEHVGARSESVAHADPRTRAEIVLRQPAQIPPQIAVRDEVTPPAPFGVYVPGTKGTAGPGGVIGSLGIGVASTIPKAPSGCGSHDSTLAYERGRPGSQSCADLSTAGPKRSDSGCGDSAGDDREVWCDRESQACLRTSHARPGGD